MIENNEVGDNAPALEATDQMVEAAILLIQDRCEIGSAAAAASIVRDIWDRMIENAPSGYLEKLPHQTSRP
jgi:hypothetical protein